MSLVLAGGNKNFIVVAGDQRVLDKQGQVLSENYRKVFKINEDFIVAFAGKIPYCKAILEPVLERGIKEESMFDNVNMSEAIEHRARMAEEELAKTGEKCFFSIIVCGKMLHTQSRDLVRNPLFMHVYNYNGSLSIQKNLLNDFGIRWSALYGSNYDHKKVCKQLFESTHAITQNEVEKVFKQTILNGSRNDKTVNNNILFEYIEA
ncbi:MAG: hypothetical protein E7253_04015 [Lachnospiraceae bacterium]|nr:hypothetical protein [Lachnospiraceae bacterium]